MKKTATVTSLEKRQGGTYWCALVFDGRTSDSKMLSIQEFKMLNVGDQIELDVEWNDDGIGMKSELNRPIKILKGTF